MKKFLFILTLLPILVLGQSNDQNYVKTKTYKVATSSSMPTPATVEAAQSVTYFDGLGRPIEQVSYKQSGTGHDIVTPIAYDGFGRQPKEYLPIVSGQTLNFHGIDSATIVNYYGTPTIPTMEATLYPYSEKLFEASPLNRVLKQAAPGDDWRMGNGHEVRFDYQANGIIGDEYIRLLVATASWNSTYALYNISLTTPGNTKYNTGELYLTITKNENWKLADGKNNTTEEFKDKEGHVLLKRTYNGGENYDTYYVYDQFGNLTYVIPPMVDATNGVVQSVLDGMCYQYKYDSRNRLVEKKLPGKEWELIVYNSQDKPVATGPVKNPWGLNTTGWMITKYDAFGRVVYTGWYGGIIPKQEGRKTFQDLMGGNYWAEEYTGTTTATIDNVAVSYTNTIYTTDFKLLTVNYYDSYDNPLPQFVPSNIEGEAVLQNPKSLATANWIRVLTSPTETYGESTVIYYDLKGRTLGTRKINHLGGYTDVDTQLDFTGKTVHTTSKHKYNVSDNEIMVTDMFYYTEQDRLSTHKQQVIMGGQSYTRPEETLTQNEYDDLGQLISKRVGSASILNNVGLQKIDYRYNIRGWLTDINDANDLTKADEPEDLFGFRINYNQLNTGPLAGPAEKLYNGNISQTFWKSSSDNILRKYGYQYDNLNRLINAVYQKPYNTIPVTHMYDEEISYDKNGNITELGRYGDFDADDSSGALQIDKLRYTYHLQKMNQLMRVQDNSTETLGFKDDNNTGIDPDDDYTYDALGNMLSDTNKGIDSISYNHLNLPVKIYFASGDKIEYLYNAAGQKRTKTVIQDEGKTVTDYHDGYQYSNGILKFFPHAEGYVNVVFCDACSSKNQTRFNYVYNYLDHLGNIRMSYGVDPETEELKILEENHYYPFGLKHTNYNNGKREYQKDEEDPEILKVKSVPGVEDVAYKYRYNSKEWQDELSLNLYDYGARNYDPAIGRWMNIDPLAEKSRRWSTYSYCYNNPMRFTDPEGMQADDVIITGEKSKEAFKQLKSSTNLKLKMDDNGKVTASGNAKTDADKKLLEATTDPSVTVKVNATSSNFTDKGNWFVGGAFGGSTVEADGKVTANQTVNPEQTQKIDNFYETAEGSSILHEVIEAFIGGKESPGIGAPTFDDVNNKTPTGVGYVSAHDKADKIDPRHKDPNLVADPSGIYISKFPYSPLIPKEMNPEVLINNLKK